MNALNRTENVSGSQELRILQCSKDIRPGGGICGVAYELEKEFARMGVPASRLTLASLGHRRSPVLRSRWLIVNKLLVVFDAIVFSSVGTVMLRRRRRWSAGTVSIVHDEILAGEIFVNHGLYKAMILSSGRALRMLLHNPLHALLLFREWLRYQLGVHRRVVCFSRSERDLLIKHYPRAKSIAEVIPNGVDLERFYPDVSTRVATRRSLEIAEGDFIAIFVGHYFERKGLEILINAIALLPQRVGLIVVGESAQSTIARYRDMAVRKCPQHRIQFLGRRGDVAALLNASDVFVLPSAYEAWPLVGLEAMACGLPVLMTPVGAVPEFLRDGENGLLVERNAADVASKIRTVLDDTALTASMGKRARETALEFSWAAVARQYLSLAQRVMQER